MKQGTTFAKELTQNDTGETESHQAGIHIPKGNGSPLGILPSLDCTLFNPDTWIVLCDPDGVEWQVRFVYYNSKLHRPKHENSHRIKSGRDEYRLTHIREFLKIRGARSGDILSLTYESPGRYLARTDAPQKFSPGVIKLRGWVQIC